jgi:hypothetical protein
MPAMKLPFNQIVPGTFDSAFPKPPTNGLPPAGVESRARQMQPTTPMINTMASDRVAKLGMNGQVPAPMQAMSPAPMMRPAAQAASPLGGMSSRSPLGGMPSRSLSGRGGPMSYSPRGVGTNNPNSYAVGKNNKNFAERTGQMPMQQAPGMLMGASNYTAPAMTAPASAGMAPAGMAPAGRDDAFWSQMSADAGGFMASQDKLGADMQAADDQAAAKIEERAQATAQEIMGDMRKTARARETFPSLDPETGAVNERYYTSGTGMMVPRNQVEAPLPPEMMPTKAMRGGVEYKSPTASKPSPQPKVTYQTDPVTGEVIGGTYTVIDSKTGEMIIRKARMGGDTQSSTPNTAGQTKSGNSFTFNK